MKNDLTCGVVRDLLPSYVEGLTSPESNTAVASSVRVPGLRPASDGAGRRAGAGGPGGRKRGRLSEKSKAPGLAACGGGSCRHGAAVHGGRRGKAVCHRGACQLGLPGESQLDGSHKCAGTVGSAFLFRMVCHCLQSLDGGKQKRHRSCQRKADPAVIPS